MKLVLSGIRGIKYKIKALVDTPFARTMMGDIGMFSMMRIKKRTIKGEDVSGINFAPYSKAYADERSKRGFPVKPVDLTRTGSMLASMTYDSDRNSVDIFFANTQGPQAPGYPNKTRQPEKAYYLHQDREFFALSVTDIKGIMKIVSDYYNRLLKG